MLRGHLRLRNHLCGAWMGIVSVLILAALPLLAAGTSSASAAQTIHPISYLPLVQRPPYQIAFVSGLYENQEIYVMHADGFGQTKLTHFGHDGYCDISYAGLAWSPDGKRIAFVHEFDTGCTRNIYLMNADGSGQTRLTNDPGYISCPVWSPR